MLSVGMLMTPGQAGKPFILPHTASEILNLYCRGGGTNEFDEMREVSSINKEFVGQKMFIQHERQIAKPCKISKNYFQLVYFFQKEHWKISAYTG